jgi:hypothetical protein
MASRGHTAFSEIRGSEYQCRMPLTIVAKLEWLSIGATNWFVGPLKMQHVKLIERGMRDECQAMIDLRNLSLQSVLLINTYTIVGGAPWYSAGSILIYLDLCPSEAREKNSSSHAVQRRVSPAPSRFRE